MTSTPMPLPIRSATKRTLTFICAAATGLMGCDDSQTQEMRITPEQVASSLQPAIQIAGEPARNFDLADRMAYYNVPGVSVAVMDGGEIIWAQGWGLADEETGQPVTAETLFQAASISKPVAALVAMSMVEDGLLSLDGPINDDLTSWQVPENEFTADSAVTLRGLLSHTAGLTVWGFPGYSKAEEYAPGQAIPTNVQVLDGLGNTDSVRVFKEPGISFRYSGGGYTVMEQAIEDVTGQPFHVVAAERVLTPAGMAASTYAQPLPTELWDRASRAYRGNGSEVEGEWHSYPEQAAAGLWTTPTELLTLGRHLTGVLAGDVDDGVVSTPIFDLMATGHRSDEEGFDTYGLGFGVGAPGEPRFFGHGGANEGFRATWRMFPEAGQGVAIMTNGDRGDALYWEILRGIAAAMGWDNPVAEVRSARPLTREQADAYAGTFEVVGGDVVVTVRHQGEGLVVVVPDQGESTLRADAEAEDTFFSPDDGQVIKFERDESGRVVVMIAGGTTRLVRVDAAG